MYEPLFNTVLVEIVQTLEDKYSPGNDESMLGKAYRLGKVIDVGRLVRNQSYPLDLEAYNQIKENLEILVGKNVMWNEGVEAGTVFEFDNKQFALIYWFDLRGVKVEP